MLSALADNTKLRPYIIFKHNSLRNITVPYGIVVRVADNCGMNSDLVIDWLKTIWENRPGAMLAKRLMLVLDAF